MEISGADGNIWKRIEHMSLQHPFLFSPWECGVVSCSLYLFIFFPPLSLLDTKKSKRRDFFLNIYIVCLIPLCGQEKTGLGRGYLFPGYLGALQEWEGTC